MKLTKEDYMRLPKERLAELLAEMDSYPIEPIVIPPQPTTPTKPSGWGCDGTVCTNPQMDCIDCPLKTTTIGRMVISPNINTTKGNPDLHASFTDGKEHQPSFIE